MKLRKWRVGMVLSKYFKIHRSKIASTYSLVILLFFNLPLKAQELNSITYSKFYSIKKEANYAVDVKQFDEALNLFNKILPYLSYFKEEDLFRLGKCYIQTCDTENTLQLLHKLILNGEEMPLIDEWYNIDSFYNKIKPMIQFDNYHNRYVSKLDSSQIKRVDEMLKFDQLLRNYQPEDSQLNGYKIMVRDKIDSLLFIFLMNEFLFYGFPSQEKLGDERLRLIAIIMHASDHAGNWEIMSPILLKSIFEGTFYPDLYALIADRHSHVKNRCYQFGHLFYGNFPLCDCKNVDSMRVSIGLDSLKNHYQRVGLPLPECYLK
ncbi:MAG: hypothetical protein R2831_04100 [Chitinophagaceae bacterium]